MNVAGSARAVIIVLTQMAPINARVCVVSVCRVTDVPARWPQVRHSQAQSNNISLQHLLVEIRGAGPCRGGRQHASGRLLFDDYGHDGPGVCLGDGQTEDEGVPSQGGRGDALLWRMSLYLT